MARGSINISVTGTYNDRDIKNAIRDLNALRTQASPATSAFQKLGASFAAMPMQMAGQFLGIGAAIGAVTVAADLAAQALSSMVSSAAEDEKAMRSLEIAMRNVGQAAHMPQVAATIDQLSRMSGVADDQLIPAMRTLVTATGNAAKAQSLLQLAMDISAGTGKSLETVVAALGRASLGSTTALSRLGAGIDKATLASGDMDVITAALTARFSGQAAAAADTFSGKMDRISVAVAEAGEGIGYQLIAAIETAIDAFGGTNGLAGAIQVTGEKLATMAKGIGPTTEALIAITKATSPLVIVLDKLGVSAVDAVLLLNPLTASLLIMGKVAEKSEAAQAANADALLGTLDAASLATGGLSDLADETNNTADAAVSATNSYLSFYEALALVERGQRDLAGTSGTVSSALAEGARIGGAAGYWEKVRDQANGVGQAMGGAGGSARKAGDDIAATAAKWRTSTGEIATATTELATAIGTSTVAMTQGALDPAITGLGTTLTGLVNQVAKHGDDMGAGLVGAFGKRLEGLSAKVQGAVDQAKQAVDALNNYSKGVVSNVMGNLFQVSTTGAGGEQLTPEGIFNNILGGADTWQSAAGSIAPFLTKLPEQVATQLYQLPPDQIQKIADYFSANPAMLERLTQRYNELAVWTETNLGVPMAETFAKVGDQSAVEMLKSAKKTIAESAAAFTAFVRSKLATTIDVDVVYHARGAGIPGRAMGGPVSASAAYLVGEMGPELFVPDMAGSIIPNSALMGMRPTSLGGGGNTYNITVQAGIGDPREIGRQVVEVVKAYERASGPVFAGV